MKKFFIALFCITLINNINYAAQNSVDIDKLENSIFGFTYTGDDTARISRLEKEIYGKEKNGDIQSRLKSLNKDMSAGSLGLEITPKEDTFAEDDVYYPDRSKKAQNSQYPSGSNVDYPSINEIEKEIFKTEYKTQDISTRLTNLEKKVLGKTYDTEPLATRVERLQAKVKPKSFMENNLAQSSNNFFDEEIVPMDKDYYLDEYGMSDFDYDTYNSQHKPYSKVNISSVEKMIYKKTYNNDSIEERLTRLESTMFGTTFKSDTEETRMNRITSAYRASKSANKYDSNKFTQNMATAMQIGTIILMILACVL